MNKKVSISIYLPESCNYRTLYAHIVKNVKNCQEHEIKKIVLVATFKLSVATCGEWRQGWTTLL